MSQLCSVQVLAALTDDALRKLNFPDIPYYGLTVFIFRKMFRHIGMVSAVLFKTKSNISQCRQTDRQMDMVNAFKTSVVLLLQLQTVKQMASGRS
jgi:hypothetical protein